MPIYFMGGEPSDFNSLNNNTFLTQDTDRFRSKFARCAISCGGGTDFRNTASGSFSQQSSNFWFTSQVFFWVEDSLAPGFTTFLVFTLAGTRRLGFQVNDQRQMRMVRFNDGQTATVIATTPGPAIQNTGVHKIDIRTTYDVNGSVDVYLDQTLAFSYAGDVTVSGISALDGFGLSSINTTDRSSTDTCWSEVIVTNRDTRTFMLKTHTPNSTSSANTWAGTHADIAEIVPNDATVISTKTVDDLAEFGLTGLPSNNLTVRAFKVSARVSRGEAGPTKVSLGVNTANTVSFGPDLPVDTGWTTVSNIWESNPTTNGTWTESQINAIEIDLKAKN